MYKARVVVYGNKEYDFVEDCFAADADYAVLKLMMYLYIQRSWVKLHLDFDKAFPISLLERSIYVELSKCQFGEGMREDKVMKLSRTLYRLKDAARTWNKLIFQERGSQGLKELNSAPCVFVKKQLFATCHVDDLIIYAKKRIDHKCF